jgi:predicted thioesterase
MSLMGRTAEATLRVKPADGVDERQDTGERAIAAVPAASRLAEVMELAAARLMRPNLDAGQTSVAVSTDLHHVARASGTLRAVATYEGMSRRLHHFNVNVFDASGLVASGRHTRAVVVESRLLAIARRRADQPAMLAMP